MGSCEPGTCKFPLTRTVSWSCAQSHSAPVRPAGASPLYSVDTRSRFGGQPSRGEGATERDVCDRGSGHLQEPWHASRAGSAALEGPLPAHAGSKPRPSLRSPHPPAPNPIRAWHRLSNRLTNPAPPIAGHLGRGLSYQASLRGPSFKSLKLFQAKSSSTFSGIVGHRIGVQGT